MKLSKKIIIILGLIVSILLNNGAYSKELNKLSQVKTELANPQTKIKTATTAKQTISDQQCIKTDIQTEISLDMPKDHVRISLEDSLKTALDNNYNIKIITTEQNQNKWLYYNALSDYLPDIAFNYNQTKLNGQFLLGGALPFAINAQSINTGFTGQVQAFSGLYRVFNAQAYRSAYNASKRNLDLTREQTLLQSSRQYYALLQDKLNIQILSKALEQNQAQLKINQQRFDAGVGTRFDVIRAEAQVAQAKQDLIAAYNRLKLTQAQLANIIGVDVFTPLVPSEDEVEAKTLLDESFDINKVTEIAIANQPGIDIAKFNISTAKARRNTAYSIYLPNVTVSSSINGSGDAISNLFQNNSVALIVGWQGLQNLGMSGLTSVKVMNEQVKQAELRLVDTTRNLQQGIVSSYYSSITAKELIATAKSQVAAAEESLRLAVIRQEAGVGIYTDVIEAQLSETRAKINYLNAIINYNVAQAQLLYDMGIISVNNLLTGYGPKNEPTTKKK